MSHFDKKAKEWDFGNGGDMRKQNALNIAQNIKKEIDLNKDMIIADFGVGTGFLGFEIAKEVKKVYGLDNSKEMLKRLQEKNTHELSIEPVFIDLTTKNLDQKFDGIVSSMTLHHIKDLDDIFKKFYNMLNDKGFIALADLESEDGTFHSDNTGVFHFGFDEKTLKDVAKKAGFKDISFRTIHTIKKPNKEYPVFLLTAKKQM